MKEAVNSCLTYSIHSTPHCVNRLASFGRTPDINRGWRRRNTHRTVESTTIRYKISEDWRVRTMENKREVLRYKSHATSTAGPPFPTDKETTDPQSLCRLPRLQYVIGPAVRMYDVTLAVTIFGITNIMTSLNGWQYEKKQQKYRGKTWYSQGLVGYRTGHLG